MGHPVYCKRSKHFQLGLNFDLLLKKIFPDPEADVLGHKTYKNCDLKDRQDR